MVSWELENMNAAGPTSVIPPVVIVSDGSGTIIGSNDAARKFFACSEKELAGRKTETLAPGGNSELAAAIRGESGREDRTLAVTLRRGDGSSCRGTASYSKVSESPVLFTLTFHPESREQGQAALLRRLIDALPDYLFIKDPENRILINNLAHARNLGLTPEQCVGRTDRDFFPPHLADLYISSEQHVVKSGTVYQDEEATIDRKGNHRWKLTTKIPLRGPEGEIFGLAGINHDITEMKQAQRALAESEERHRTLYHNTPVMLHSFDMDNVVEHVSDYWLNSMGYTRQEVEGESALKFYSDEARRYFSEVVLPEFRNAGRISNVPLEYVTKDGRKLLIEVSAVAQHDADGKVIGGLAVSTDVTERKRAEAEREELHRRLLDLSRHAGMAEVATGVLHNVGNVLNSVNVAAGVLTDKVRNSPVKKLARAVDLMKQHEPDLGTYITADPQGRQLPGYFNAVTTVLQAEEQAILNELSVLSKHVDHIKEIVRVQQTFAKSTRIIESLDLASVIDDAMRISSPTTGAVPVKVEVNCPRPTMVQSDKHALLQILTNLVGNAYQAVRESNNPEKQISIRADRTAREGRTFFSIHVVDNGVGIEPQNVTRIFNHGFTTKVNGHGFGLHSAANTAKRLGGSLEASSPGPGQGATFVLTLPASKEVIPQ